MKLRTELRKDMISRGAVFLATVCTFSSAQVQADAKTKTQADTPIDKTITVKLPPSLPSEIEAQYQEEVKEDPRRATYLDLGASSWVPGSFSLPAPIEANSSFQRNGLPAFYANLITQVVPGSDFSFKGGLNWLSLSRNGINPSQGASSLANQTIQLFSIRLGAEYSPRALSNKYLAPYAGAALLPSVIFAPSSPFNVDGSTYGGVPVELGAGVRFKLAALGINLSGSEFYVGAIGTLGTIDHSSVGGIGINGGFRIAL